MKAIKFTQQEIDILTNFKNTYQKYNPIKHEDYDKVNVIIDSTGLVPSDLLFKKKLEFILGVINGTFKIDKFYGECYVCNTHFKKVKPSSFMCRGCKDQGIQYCKKHHYIHGMFGYSTCLQCDVEKSHKKFQDKKPVTDFVECKLCGLRSGDLATHYQKVHGLEKSQYARLPVKKGRTIERMKGENNPGYNHGGRFSPLSRNFVKYQDMDEAEVEASILSICEKSTQSRKDNISNNTTLDYYLLKGMTLEEAHNALSERQMTFSLDKCIERHGETEGLEVWKKRQEKWMGTLNSKPQGEKDIISKKKAVNFNYRVGTNNSDINGMFYILEIDHNGSKGIKIGITTHDVEKRYGRVVTNRMVKTKRTYNMDIATAFRVEQLLKEKFKSFIINKEERIEPFGWTETFTHDALNILVEYCEQLLCNREVIHETFNRVFK
jgi:hypothetical protein